MQHLASRSPLISLGTATFKVCSELSAMFYLTNKRKCWSSWTPNEPVMDIRRGFLAWLVSVYLGYWKQRTCLALNQEHFSSTAPPLTLLQCSRCRPHPESACCGLVWFFFLTRPDCRSWKITSVISMLGHVSLSLLPPTVTYVFITSWLNEWTLLSVCCKHKVSASVRASAPVSLCGT